MPHKLLLADDSVTIQRVIELTFADEDVQVIAVGNGQAAIDFVQRERPDIVLADVGMPERNGYEVAAFIKGDPATAHIPVVLLTGAFEPVDEARARSVGCDGVLVKPFEPQIVISRVKDLLAGKQPPGMWGTGPVAHGAVRQAAQGFESRPPAAGSAVDPLEAYFDHLDAAFSSGPAAAGTEPPLTIPAAPARRDPIPVSRIPAPSPQGAPKPSPNDPFADWDPDLMGDPSRPGPIDQPLVFPPREAAPVQHVPPPAPRAAQPAPQAAAPAPVSAPSPTAAAAAPAAPAPAAAARVTPPSLVEAFAALLAAEERIGLSPSAATTPAPASASGAPAPVVTEELIETIAARVAARQPPAPNFLTEEMVETVTSRVVARLTDQSRQTILDAAERLVREEIERIKANQ
jgi:CheY-like chemotaxis protein